MVLLKLYDHIECLHIGESSWQCILTKLKCSRMVAQLLAEARINNNIDKYEQAVKRQGVINV